ncbi:MAG: hypothetical protein ABIJ40_13410 [Bacteroidota bacterium]
MSVSGYPNSGKSHLIEKLANKYQGNGFDYVMSFGGRADENTFAWINSEFNKYKDYKFLVIFHYGLHRDKRLTAMGLPTEDPNYLAQSILGMNIDLNIGIYNPKFEPKTIPGSSTIYQPHAGPYDLIIKNSRSVNKYAR